MDKLHTHYDNLKIARQAPPEVIRAAYKVLSQKYHPDKNPGDEKAARIMAIINSAYCTLSDDQLRKEHDDWIAAEEWEIDWLESSRQEDSDAVSRSTGQSQHRDSGIRELVPYKPSRDPKWWLILAACVALGWVGSIYAHASRGGYLAGKPDEKAGEVSFANWFGLKSDAPVSEVESVPKNKVIVLSQVRLFTSSDKCTDDAREQLLMAPNGKPWPAHSGYVEGYRVDNMGGYTELTLDNSKNTAAVYVTLFDVEAGQNVRHVFVGARDKFTLEKLIAGNYAVYPHSIGSTSPQEKCSQRNGNGS